MKTHFILFQLMLTLTACHCACAQGFIYDQQVSNVSPPGSFNNIVPQPSGQSFIPTISTVGFVEFYLTDPDPNHAGATMCVNLWSGSITGGTLIGQTASISLPGVFLGSTNFIFSTPPSVIAGSTYYLQLVIQSGDNYDAGVVLGSNGYSNGTAFFGGVANSAQDLWFREGIVVPEPSSIFLSFFGFAGLYVSRRKKR